LPHDCKTENSREKVCKYIRSRLAAYHLPHIHAQYAEHGAIISIDNGGILDGDLPRSKMKLVQAWIEIHKDELLADWKLAVEGQRLFKIEPLR
jgi:hypothetical protein